MCLDSHIALTNEDERGIISQLTLSNYSKFLPIIFIRNTWRSFYFTYSMWDFLNS